LFDTGRKRGDSKVSGLTAPPCFPIFEILADEPERHRVDRNKPDLAALALYPRMWNPLPRVNVFQTEQTQLLTTDTVIKQYGHDCPVAHAFERIEGRGLQKPPRLRITKGRGAAFVVIGNRALDRSTGLPRTSLRSHR
jgi:hypothetical protein